MLTAAGPGRWFSPGAQCALTQDQKPARIWREVMASTAPLVIGNHLGLAAETPALMVVLRLEDKGGRAIEWRRAFGKPTNL
ncbi:GntR family transcriptional regulator [Mycobacteroides abscessus]|uniref:hypothetical protein n=1 Tax=Mycobacteroides abscessus TaxID=36809 RepID=UPI000C26822E|nr:hypothetical protein [Mycobacteroides abscessus]